MAAVTSRFDVCVVGGAGHVGAPLSVVLASRGLRTLAFDVNASGLQSLTRGEFPFFEEGGEPLLRQVLSSGRITFSSDVQLVAGVPLVVITVGTPIDEFRNPRLDVMTRCLDDLLPHLSDEQTIILRSTVYPGVTDRVDRYLHERGRNNRVAFCPERVVQGKAIVELQTLPQIVSGTTPEAEDTAASLFEQIAPSVVRMVPREAEFAKLISNAWRYIGFAAANQFYMLVESAGLDYARMIAGLKDGYARAADLPSPGFAAGPCLMKDTMQLVAFDNNRFLLGNVAMMINEGLPNFLVEQLRHEVSLSSARIGILGMAFKAEIDDIRDSLSYKLGKILRFNCKSVFYSDEYAQDPTFVSKEELVARSDVVIVGVPHHAYRNLEIPSGVVVVDLWGILPQRPSGNSDVPGSVGKA
jgi:UDP-N-acetyl-D-mannosaminuronic acid dehydrogenase